MATSVAMAEGARGPSSGSSAPLVQLTSDWVDSFLESKASRYSTTEALICFACVAQRKAAVAGRAELYLGICGEGAKNVRLRIAEFARTPTFRHSPGLVCPGYFPGHLVSAVTAAARSTLETGKHLACSPVSHERTAHECLSGGLRLYVQCNAVEQPAESLRMVAPTHAMQLEAMKAKQMRKFESDPAFRITQAKRKSGAITTAGAYATFLDEAIKKRLAKGTKGDLPLWEFKRPNAGTTILRSLHLYSTSVAVTAQQRYRCGAQLLYELARDEITRFCSEELLPALCDPHRDMLTVLPTAFEDLLCWGSGMVGFLNIADRGLVAGSKRESISFHVMNTFSTVVLDSDEVQARLAAALASPDAGAEELANQCRFVVVWTRTFCAVDHSTKCSRLCSGSSVIQLQDVVPPLLNPNPASAQAMAADASIVWSRRQVPVTILEGEEAMTYTFSELLATIREGRT